MMKKKETLFLLSAVILAITLPYVLGFVLSGDRYVFSGFLTNSTDANSYLAKIEEGASGGWKFTLPYTAKPGEGAYLFLYYLFLGHLSTWMGIPTLLVLHLARLFGAACLVLALVSFFGKVFQNQPQAARMAAWLAAFGAGLGWLVIPTGFIPSDFWVAEAYPFLSAYSNAHFPLGLALLLWIFLLINKKKTTGEYILLILLGLLEAVIMQFGLVIAALAASLLLLWNWIEGKKFLPGRGVVEDIASVLCLVLLGGPYLVYQLWIIQTDPVLAGWNSQNITLSPAVWDLVLSFSPALLLALYGAWHLLRSPKQNWHRLLLAWFFADLVLIYFPFWLQRRFLLGLYIPTAALAVIGGYALAEKIRKRWVMPILVGLSLPTTFFLILLSLAGILTHSSQVYLTIDEYHALEYIRQSTPPQSVILASPEMGQFIPAQTGRRVIYGHPFETVNAKQEERNVRSFYDGTWTGTEAISFLMQRNVAYVLYGPREQKSNLRFPFDSSLLQPVYHSGDVTLYQVSQP